LAVKLAGTIHGMHVIEPDKKTMLDKKIWAA
jgi:hypothetical protein